MPTVDLIYDTHCPNVTKARTNLMRAFSRARIPASWSEYGICDSERPQRVRGYGSPTILVDGLDVAGLEPTAEECCRVYLAADGSSGAPSVEQIVEALSRPPSRECSPPVGNGRWRTNLAMLPGVGAALLPKLACPACWPAYAGLMSSLGLGFLLDTVWLLPLTVAFLGVAVGALAFRAQRRRGYAPVALGVAASVFIIAGKFLFDSGPAMILGISMLVGSSIWNSWPRRADAACPACHSAT